MAGHSQRSRMFSMAAGDNVMTVEDRNPQRREQGPWRQRLGRWSTGAPTDVDVAAGQQAAVSSVGHRVPHEARSRARSLT